jgi:SAM-dependent methyltransferase
MADCPRKLADLADRTRAELHAPYERQLAPLGHRAMSALSPKHGKHILDIGCGTGQTSVELGELVGPEGEVLGVDLAPAVLEVALGKAKGLAQVRFIQADAQVFPFEPGLYDAAFSRFGVMFFADPVAAFVNIRRALKVGGRVTFVCWRSLEENELDTVPLKAASPFLPADLEDPRFAPPFSLSSSDRIRDILSTAGFSEMEILAHDEQVGSGDLRSMLELTLRVGSLGKIVRERPELLPLVLKVVTDALVARDGPKGPTLNAATWVVNARSLAYGGNRRVSAFGA